MKTQVLKRLSTMRYVFVVSLLVISGLYLASLKKILFLELQKEDIEGHTEVLRDYFDDYRREVKILANPEHFRQFFTYHSPQDFSDEISVAEYSKLFNFTYYLLSDPLVSQARFINEKGFEMIRTDQENSAVVIIPPTELQDKSDRYYFQKGIKTLENQVYISPIDLNIENEKIEVPYQLTVRFIAPILDPLSRIMEGMVVLNIDAKKIFNHFQQQRGKSHYVFDEQGYFVVHPDSSLLYGRDLPHHVSYFDTYPEDKLVFFEADQSTQQRFKGRKLQTWKKLQYDTLDSERFYILMSEVDLPFWLWW